MITGDITLAAHNIQTPTVNPPTNNNTVYNTGINKNNNNSDPNVVVNNTSSGAVDYFPSDIGKYKMLFSFVAYNRASAKDPIRTVSGPRVALPIPNNLVDSYKPSYSATELGAAGYLLDTVENKYGGLEHYRSGDSYDYKGIAKDVAVTVAGLGVYGGIIAASVAAPGLTGAVLQDLGVAQNPYLTLLFKGMDLKSHSFKWRFNPQSIEETASLRNIINTFKKHSLPTIVAGNPIFTIPDMVNISLSPEGDNMYKFKPAVVTGIVINYSPNPTPSFFVTSNAPTTIELSISFQEVQIWTSDDIEGAEQNIGASGSLGARVIQNVDSAIQSVGQ